MRWHIYLRAEGTLTACGGGPWSVGITANVSTVSNVSNVSQSTEYTSVALYLRGALRSGKNGRPAEQTLPGALGRSSWSRGCGLRQGSHHFYRLLVHQANSYHSRYLCKSYSCKVPDEARMRQDNRRRYVPHRRILVTSITHRRAHSPGEPRERTTASWHHDRVSKVEVQLPCYREVTSVGGERKGLELLLQSGASMLYKRTRWLSYTCTSTGSN
ncbi:hypothetical protein GGR53DRAFT_195121 [Hypoxylon sp. FL1150]|nr:hypothetical protein GGR53DRAFT_195121 [Hypoxylon sp. FL1150]